jgi:hypothetical protein
MPCLVAILALATPRLVIVCLYVFTDWFRGIFGAGLWPILLGFVFLPTTLLWYTVVMHYFGGVWTLWPILGLVIALAIDVSPAAGRRRKVVVVERDV